MSSVLAVNDVLISEVVCYDGPAQQIAVLRRHWLVSGFTGFGGPIQFQDVATYIDTNFSAAIIALLYNGAEYRGTRVRRAFPVNSDAWQFDNTNSGNGTAGAVALPTQSAGLLTFVGNTLGKKGEGRQYLPFAAVADNQTIGQPTPGYVTKLNTLGLLWVTPIVLTVAGLTANLIPGASSNPFTSFVSINQYRSAQAWATQKRRGSYGKFNRPPF